MGSQLTQSQRLAQDEFPLLKMKLLFTLVSIALVGQSLAQDDDCTMKNCKREVDRCLGMKPCKAALECLGKCTVPDGPMCAYDCGWYDPGLPIHELVQCQAIHDCLGAPTVAGECVGTDEDVEVAINSFGLIAGDWWVVRGFGGIWGTMPCTKINIDADANEYLPMVHECDSSFCYGQNSMCDSPYMTVYGNMRMVSPGVFNKTTTSADVIHPEVADMRFLALGLPEAEYALMSYCSKNPTFEYNNLHIVSRKRTFDEISDAAMQVIKDKVISLGVDWDMDLHNVDCSMCAN